MLWLFVVEDEQPALDAVYNAAVVRELDAITAAIPHRDLAIQFDIASAVFARLERGEAVESTARTKEEMQETFSTIVVRSRQSRAGRTSSCCFISATATPVIATSIEPTDMGDMVRVGQPARPQ